MGWKTKAGIRDFFQLQIVRTGCGIHPDPYLVVTGFTLPGGKVVEA